MKGFLISPAYMSRPGIPARQKLLKTELKMAHVLDSAHADDREIEEKVTLWRDELQIQRLGGAILGSYSEHLHMLNAIYSYYRPVFVFDLRRHMGALPHSLCELAVVASRTFRSDVACLVDPIDERLVERCGMYGDTGTSVAELAVAIRESEAVMAV